MEKRHNYKKQRATILVALIALITAIACLCGVTFAKYVSSATVNTKKAQVAKWGFVVKADATNLFGSRYQQDGSTQSMKVVATPTADADGVIMSGSAAAPLGVAPGTKGYMTFSIAGSAEVASKITMEMLGQPKSNESASDEVATPYEIVLSGGDIDSKKSYTPIAWSLYTATSALDVDADTWTIVSNVTTLAGVQQYLVDNSATSNVTETKKETIQKAGGSSVASYYLLKWEWKFANDNGATSDADKASAIAKNDKYDTIIGYVADYVAGGKKADDGLIVNGKKTYGVYKIEYDKKETTDTNNVYIITDTSNTDTTKNKYYLNDIYVGFYLSITVEQVLSGSTGA